MIPLGIRRAVKSTAPPLTLFSCSCVRIHQEKRAEHREEWGGCYVDQKKIQSIDPRLKIGIHGSRISPAGHDDCRMEAVHSLSALSRLHFLRLLLSRESQ